MSTLLERINRNHIFPPPRIEEVLNFFKPKYMRDRKCNAYKIFRYSVGKECKRIGESNVTLIGRATNHLWKNSTIQEKSGYINLGQIFQSFQQFQTSNTTPNTNRHRFMILWPWEGNPEIIELRRRIMRLKLKILKLKPRVEEHEVKFTNLEQRDKEKTNPVAKLDDDIKEIKKAYSEKES
ncbi:hypothetical protein Glove_374g49 [Diversispora epigaea]|uniref:HMG box domain-containing protein n=1 Tax=Diversispora epigaea TaxID=1348612 RepID=A0A397H5G2_9GLOM|nr:hypothetical protein Glove_374g49 [Diversispora epigaea]